MKVLHVLDAPVAGGAAVAAQSVMDSLGHRSMMYGPKTGSWARALRTVGGYCDPMLRRAFRDQLKRLRPNLVNLHNFKDAGTAAIAACKDLSIPVVWSVYDWWCLCPRDTLACPECRGSCSWWRYRPAKARGWPRPLNVFLFGRQRRIMRWLNRLDAVVVLSRDSETRLINAGLTDPLIYVVPLPIMVPALRLVERDPKMVLFLGGRASHKGEHIFDTAMRMVMERRPEARPVALYTQDRAVALDHIAAAACLVVPELWPNPGPVVISEAQLLGTPVVASDIGGIAALQPTFLIAPDHVEGFANAICHVLKSAPYFPTSRETANAKRRCDPKTARQHLTEIYDVLTGGPDGPASHHP